jgi:hypothetical protein
MPESLSNVTLSKGPVFVIEWDDRTKPNLVARGDVDPLSTFVTRPKVDIVVLVNRFNDVVGAQ